MWCNVLFVSLRVDFGEQMDKGGKETQRSDRINWDRRRLIKRGGVVGGVEWASSGAHFRVATMKAGKQFLYVRPCL